jgi:hypothetical protein
MEHLVDRGTETEEKGEKMNENGEKEMKEMD